MLCKYLERKQNLIIIYWLFWLCGEGDNLPATKTADDESVNLILLAALPISRWLTKVQV
jgi:hypothetical protein